MDSAFIPAVCGFAGAAFGALVSVAGVCFAQWQETKRKMFSEVINAAVKFWEVDVSFHSKCKVWGQRTDTVQQFKEPGQRSVPRIF